jgi:putative ABC transport system permease protein
MFFSYIKIAIRSILRHRFFSFINIFGLAVSMSISMGIIMLVADQVEYDRYNSKRDRIYRVITKDVDAAGKEVGDRQNAASSMPLRGELLEKYTGIEKVVRLKRGFGNHWLEFEGQDVNIPLAGFYADPEVFEVFEYEFQYGDPSTALKDPFTVVLTRKAANKLFKEENPLGQSIKVGELGNFTVTGVLKETPHKSHIVFEALASMATVVSVAGSKDRSMDDWTDFWNGWNYVLLEPGKSGSDLQQYLKRIYDEKIAVITNPGVYKMKFSVQALNDITPGPLQNNSIGPVLPWVFIYALGGLALIILLTSCFNFTNLSMARSLTRAREIGVRKVTGAARWQIFVQFLSESVIVAFAALIIAFGLLLLVKPMILQLNFARIFSWDFEANAVVFITFIAFAVVVGILAGFFPAIVLSGFQPIKVLKSINNIKVFSRMGIRKVLLVAQFTLSLFFILSVIIMNNQLKLFTTKDHGFNMQNNIAVKLNNTSPQVLRNELLKYANIESVSAASHLPAAGISHGGGFKKSLDEKEDVPFQRFTVDENYLRNMKLHLLAGKFFEAGQEKINKDYIVINEEGVKKLQYDSPSQAVGEVVISHFDSTRRTIIGVISNYNHRDLTRSHSPMALMYDPEDFAVLQVSYSGTYEAAAKEIEKAWAVVNPGLKVDYNEMKSEINKYYDIVFGDIVKILGTLATLAIVISCLGLLGMATYTTETRMKEVSIRKVLGSSNGALVLLLSRSFLGVLALAIVIGIPASFFINNLWLELIAYRTSISLSVVAQAVLILLLFGVVTVGSQTIRASFANPVDNLKNE